MSTLAKTVGNYTNYRLTINYSEHCLNLKKSCLRENRRKTKSDRDSNSRPCYEGACFQAPPPPSGIRIPANPKGPPFGTF